MNINPFLQQQPTQNQQQNAYPNLQQSNFYNNLYNNTPNIISNQRSNKIGQYMYVDSYEEVLNAQAPMGGSPIMFIGNGIMWIKKIVDGQPFINAYNFAPLVAKTEDQPIVKQPQQELSFEDKISKTLEDMSLAIQNANNAFATLNERMDKFESKGVSKNANNKQNTQHTQGS